MIPQNLFPARKKAPQKMARPVPVYMEVTPPGREPVAHEADMVLFKSATKHWPST